MKEIRRENLRKLLASTRFNGDRAQFLTCSTHHLLPKETEGNETTNPPYPPKVLEGARSIPQSPKQRKERKCQKPNQATHTFFLPENAKNH